MSAIFAPHTRAISSILFCCLLLVDIAILIPHATAAESQKPADVIFLNGDIYAGAATLIKSISAAHRVGTMPLPRVQGLAVRDGRIVATGTNAEIKKLKGKHTEVVDLGGHFVMPGFNDAHAHLANGGIDYLHVELAGSK